jgi:hypothetical protein
MAQRLSGRIRHVLLEHVAARIAPLVWGSLADGWRIDSCCRNASAFSHRWNELGIGPQQGEADLGQLTTQRHERRRAAQTMLAQLQIVRLPLQTAPARGEEPKKGVALHAGLSPHAGVGVSSSLDSRPNVTRRGGLKGSSGCRLASVRSSRFSAPGSRVPSRRLAAVPLCGVKYGLTRRVEPWGRQ